MLLLVDEKLKQAARVMARDNSSVGSLTLTGEGRGKREEGRGMGGWMDSWDDAGTQTIVAKQATSTYYILA